MSGHASPIIINSYILQSRWATNLEIVAANERFDRAMRECEWAWEAFWASCEPTASGVVFAQAGPGGEVFEFRDGWLLEAKNGR